MKEQNCPIQKIQAIITVSGKVQGVGFRAYTRDQARKLQLTGFVKNIKNGQVLIVVEGIQSKIIQLVNWLKTTGSPSSRVDSIELDWSDNLENYNKFRVKF